ncbi:hypothetical protein HPB47_011034 [Ixodes persulcatus]|uniref:Uncharacterized protein n=1 Tax=Ixodes persulcatus TaxID=34615 RepID=A0AC60QZA6_IXOPE|nr:hypothetical protein HPB47_011034 [Ixodes persulcatus]
MCQAAVIAPLVPFQLIPAAIVSDVKKQQFLKKQEWNIPGFWGTFCAWAALGCHQKGRAAVACMSKQQARHSLVLVEHLCTAVVEDSTVAHEARPDSEQVKELKLGSSDGLVIEIEH